MEGEEEMKHIANEYSSDRMLTSEIKKRVINEIIRLTKQHQSTRAAITSELYTKFFTMFAQSDKEFDEFNFCKKI